MSLKISIRKTTMTTEAGCYEADDKEDEKRQQILPFAATRLSLALFS